MSKQSTLFNMRFLKRSSNIEDESVQSSSTMTAPISNCIEKSDSTSEPAKKKSKNTFIRKYSDSYLDYGFICIFLHGKPVPQCVLCCDVLSNEAMKPSKLKRHLETRHSEFKNKPRGFFERKSQEVKNQVKVLHAASHVNLAALKASFLISLRIAKAKKPNTIGEQLILPCAIDSCREILGEAAAKKISQIPLSNETVSRRIDAMSEDLEEQLLEKLASSPFYAIQMDESTDIVNKAILLVFVRFIDHISADICEEFLCCLELPEKTTSAMIFDVLQKYWERKNLSWRNCIGLCTDGAAAMTGRHAGIGVKIKEVAANDFSATHCVIHREQLACKTMSPELQDVLTQSVKIINFIKASALNSRLFKVLCEEMGSNHVQLLLHTEVRWLSRGKILTRLYELRNEVKVFLLGKKSVLLKHFEDLEWLAQLAYLADMFGLLNELNLSIQGAMDSVFTTSNKIEGFIKKLKRWSERVEKGCFEMFPSFSELINDESVLVNKKQIIQRIANHLKILQINFTEYFPVDKDPRTGNLWVQNPFIEHPDNKLTAAEEDELLELSADKLLQSQFQNKSVASFWIGVHDEYKKISLKALKVLLPFSSTYLCETGFSTMTIIKTKQRNRLNVQSPLRLAISKTSPRIEKLMSCFQAQGSH